MTASSRKSSKAIDWDAVDALNADIRPEEAFDFTKPYKMVMPPMELDVRSIRARTGLSQAEFARTYGFSKKALQNWEQGIRAPNRSARILLWLIDKHPKAVSDALSTLATA